MKAKISFYRCLQDSQELGSNDEHMISRIYFNLEIDGKRDENLHTDIKQTVGSDFSESGAIEVQPPEGYEGPLDYIKFRNAVEEYYKSCIGPMGTVFRIEGAKNVRMKNNRIDKKKDSEFDF